MTGTPKLRARIQAPGCRGKLSQATSTASRPPRSPDDGADPPKHARRLSKLPPTPVDTLRQPEPPQPDGLLPAAATPKAATTCSPSPAQVVEHGIRTPTRLRRAAATPMGPVLEQELSWVPGALTATWASSLTPRWRNRPAAARHRGQIDRPRHSRRSSDATDPRGTRTWPADRVWGRGRREGLSGESATMSAGGGKLSVLTYRRCCPS